MIRKQKDSSSDYRKPAKDASFKDKPYKSKPSEGKPAKDSQADKKSGHDRPTRPYKGRPSKGSTARPYRVKPVKEHSYEDNPYEVKPKKDAPAEKKFGRSDDRSARPYKGRPGKDAPHKDKPYEDKPGKEAPAEKKYGRSDDRSAKPYRGKPAKEGSYKEKPYKDRPYEGKAGKEAPAEKKYGRSEDRPARTYKGKSDKEAPAEKKYGRSDDRPARPYKDKPAKDASHKDKSYKDKSAESKPAYAKKPKTFDEPREAASHDGGDDERLFLKGRHEVVQALESGQQIDSVVISTGVKGPVGSVVRELASKSQIPVKEMNPDLFALKFGEKSQGIVAITGAFTYCSLEELAEKATNGRGVLVALNHVEDARNLGAVVRTVEASGCSGVLIPKHRAAGMNEWAIRTAQGAAAYLPVARVNNVGDALEKLKELGYWVVGLDSDADKKYNEVVYSGKVVLVAGGEDAGLGERVRKVCDDVVAIPLCGKTPSLNVSVSTAVVLYEILRQKQFFQK